MASISEIMQLVSPEWDQLEEGLSQLLSHETVPLMHLISRRLLRAGGKRLRPLLVLLCARLCQYQGAEKLILSQALEVIHTASLLHDDVIDEGHIRRGEVCAHRIWGNKKAVLSGDFLMNHAFLLMIQLNQPAVMDCLQQAVKSLIEGQLQEDDIGFHSPVEVYLNMVEKKTGALFGAACEGIGMLAGCSPARYKALRHYGMALGKSFQIIDDIYDYQVPSGSWGKKAGQDLLRKKVTLPLLLAYQQAPASEKVSLEHLFYQSPLPSEAFRVISQWIDQWHGFSQARALARDFALQAVDHLTAQWTPGEIAACGLTGLAFFVCDRAS